jgi:hypothetical protein
MERAKSNRWMGRALTVAALSAVAAMTACAGNNPAPQSKATRTSAAKPKRTGPGVGGGPLSLVTAVEMIANERCAHEGGCDRLGPGRRFRDNDACRKQLIHETRSTLGTDVCDTGMVETDSVLDCLAEIRNGTCSAETATICEPSFMCSP